MAGTINNAGSDTNPNSASKIGFWDSTFNALRQMKFSELVTWLGTYFGAPTGTTLNGDIAGFRDSFGKNLVDLGSPLAVLNSAVSPAIPGNVLTASGSTWTSATPTGGGGGGGGNWTSDSNTWTFSSADSPTFVISVNADMTALITAGTQIQLTQSATVKYFIVTAVGAYSGGATLITVYGGTDYTLANSAITSPNYSYAKAPTGFPLSPAKWTVTTNHFLTKRKIHRSTEHGTTSVHYQSQFPLALGASNGLQFKGCLLLGQLFPCSRLYPQLIILNQTLDLPPRTPIQSVEMAQMHCR